MESQAARDFGADPMLERILTKMLRVKKSIRDIRHLQQLIRRLCRVMPFFDAVRVAMANDRERETHVFLRPGNQDVVIRLGTSDLNCLEQVFIGDEYNVPFAMTPRVIVDGGANIGMSTLFFAIKFPKARIFALEPELSNFEILKRNCEHFPNVTLMRAALWPERKLLSISNTDSQKWEFIVTDKVAHESNGTSIPGVTICDILDEIGEQSIDILKLDIEGSEFELFSKNAEQWIDRVRVIAIELHDRFRPGCAHALYSALNPRKFVQEIVGGNIIIKTIGPNEDFS
jgi:FkbM family methyltransferase